MRLVRNCKCPGRNGTEKGRKVRRDSKSLNLFMAHRGDLLNYANSIVGDPSRAEDVVQEAWLRFDEVARQRLLGEPLGYLYRIVRNLALDGRRRVAREGKFITSVAFDAAEAAVSDDGQSTPEAVALYRDQLGLLMAALAELPEQTRIAFEMHRLGGCTLREIAGALDISISQAQTLVVNGVQHCKQRLKWP